MIRTSVPKTQTSKYRSKPRTRWHSSRARGFTLIEILIVIGLMALVMSMALPNLGSALKMNISNSARELATVMRSAHDEAVLKGKVHRMAFDIGKGEYWVEAEPGRNTYLMRTEEQADNEKRKNDRLTDKEKEAKKITFSIAQSVTKKKLALSRGVKFNEIITSRSKDPAKEGVVYAYLFPHGFSEKVVLYLKDNFDRDTTLFVNSATGKSRIYERFVKESEL